MPTPLLDIAVSPDFSGLPANLQSGLVHLTNNVAGLLVLISGFGIAVSVIGIVVGSWSANPHLSERSKMGLIVSAGSVAILYVAVAAANYVSHAFQG
jgi:hypothetical protein